jgi:F-type H+-transporting ATPase subunit b
MFYEAEFWVAVAFVLFVLALVKLGAHRSIFGALDNRSARIQAELDEARRLREEAQTLLTEYKLRQHEAEQEALALIRSAEAEGERLQAEARAKVDEFVARRTKMAENKIAQAEAQALAEVRGSAAEAAVAAAEKILGGVVKGDVAEKLLGDGIRELKTKLN